MIVDMPRGTRYIYFLNRSFKILERASICMSTCEFCSDEFEEFVIKEYENWEIQLFRDDQYYIGRTAVVLKSRHIENMVELTKSERDELFETVLEELNNSLAELFSPDHFNYASLGNDCRHLHFHVIPRYKGTVTFNGQTFEDEQWNETYSQDYERVRLDESESDLLKQKIRENLR